MTPILLNAHLTFSLLFAHSFPVTPKSFPVNFDNEFRLKPLMAAAFAGDAIGIWRGEFCLETGSHQTASSATQWVSITRSVWDLPPHQPGRRSTQSGLCGLYLACKKNVVRARTGGALGNATERVEVSGSESRLDWRQPEALVYPLHTPLPSPLPSPLPTLPRHSYRPVCLARMPALSR